MPGSDFLQLERPRAPVDGLAGWLTAQVRQAIADGRLQVGDRLPATRVLADDVQVSRGVVVEAYRRLTDEGLISGRPGRGTSVHAVPVAPSGRASRTPVLSPIEFDLSPGVPDLAVFPRAGWLRAERAALAGATAADLGYGDARGALALREALAGWLARTRSVRVHPDHVLVVSGVAQGLALLAQVLRQRGTRAVGFEDPGSAGTREQLEQWDLITVPVPVDGEGLDVAALTRAHVDVAVLTPAHQFPTGVVLSATRRRELLAWAAEGSRLLVEDDYDAEHRYDRRPVPALHAVAPDRVVHAGSVSKTLAPALRLGWLLAPPHLHEDLVAAKRRSDMGTPTLPQLALAHLIRSGGFDRHLRLMRGRHRSRRDAVLRALAEHLPDATVHGVAAGLHLLVTLPPGVDDRALSRQALQAGVRVPPLAEHRRLPGPPGLVVGYAACSPDRLREAVRRLAQVYRAAAGL